MILRARLFHTPRDPFAERHALEAIEDGGLGVRQGRITRAGEYAAVRRAAPRDAVVDLRPGIVLPGFVDAHVHYPQVRVVGAMEQRLLEWLASHALPEEARLADGGYARAVAREFLAGLLSAGTTTALVVGAHFPAAQAILFEEAAALGLGIASGLTLADRHLKPELLRAPDAAYAASLDLIRRWHGRRGLRYAVTPRFALSASEPLLEVAGALLREAPGLLVQTHLNESLDEIEAVRAAFPWARDYLAVYEHHGLVGSGSIFAHNLHVTDHELGRLAAAGAAVAHCPSSNAFLGSGLFPFARHRRHGVRVALGSDVGGGTGFGLLKEGLWAYATQRLRPDGEPLGPAHLLHLATRAGALALGLGDEAGDLRPGRRADFVVLRPRPGTTLATVLAHAPSAEAALGAVFTLGTDDDIAEVYVAGRPARRRRARRRRRGAR